MQSGDKRKKKAPKATVAGLVEPRICHVPKHDASIAPRALAFVREIGLTLDPWQELVLEASLHESEGTWAAKEIGLVAPRQNGKNEILLARQLVGLYLLNERLIVHSAHQWDTSMEAFSRLRAVVEDSPVLMKAVAPKGISTSHGSEGITLKGGQRIRFRTRTGGGGRGFTIDCFMFDEAMILPEMFFGALRPTLLARPNTQIWLTGSAVDQEIHEHGIVLARMRERGIAKEEEVAYFEWSHEGENPDAVPDELMEDPKALAKANPQLGKLIALKSLLLAKRSMDRRAFKVECMGVGDWPRTDGLGDLAISPEQWAACTDIHSQAQDPICFAFDLTPDRARASVCAVGYRGDGKVHVELIESRAKTDWVAAYLAERLSRHPDSFLICDASALTTSLLPQLQRLELEPLTTNANELARACGLLYDAVAQKTLVHLGQPEFADAILSAVKRPLSDAWAWRRRDSSGDISPLVAATVGLWGLSTVETGEPSFYDLDEYADAA